MSATFYRRHALLGNIVLKVFPNVMQKILKKCISPDSLQAKYKKIDIRTVLKEGEIKLMEKLPSMVDFTIELCYKILRDEHLILEPSCKWGNVPIDTEIEIADDVQRIVIATNEVISKKSEDVVETYCEEFRTKILKILIRVDTYLQQEDTCCNLYKTIHSSDINTQNTLQELAQMPKINEIPNSDAESEKRELYSRISLVIIETFPKVLRDIIRLCIPANKFYQICKPNIDTFTFDQQAKLGEVQQSNSYDSLDISLIYRLLKQFKLIPCPKKGWADVPDKKDVQLADDVVRIRCFRNQIAHRCNTNIEKDEFNNYFEQFRQIGRRMDRDHLQNTHYENIIIGYKTCRMDVQMQIKYKNTLQELENIKLRFEQRPVKFFWGDSFDRSLRHLRYLLKDQQSEERRKVRLQIILENDREAEKITDIFNSLKDDINKGLSGIEFIVATQGSIILNVDIFIEMMETDQILRSTLVLFLDRVLEHIETHMIGNINVVLLPIEEFITKRTLKNSKETVYIDFDVEAELFATDDVMEEQLGKISEAVSKHCNRRGQNPNISATLLPMDLENVSKSEEAITQAQVPVKYNFPVSVTLHQQLNIEMPVNVRPTIFDCVKIGNLSMFTDSLAKRIVVYNINYTYVYHITLSYQPYYIIGINNNTVAVSCLEDFIILIINISLKSPTSTIKTSNSCHGISYHDNNLYVVIDTSEVHVMDLTGKVLYRILLPSDGVTDITVYRNKLFCTNYKSLYCCSLDGALMWKFENDIYSSVVRITRDEAGNVYVTNSETHTVVVVSNNGNKYKELLNKSNGLFRPRGIHFDKEDNVLLVSNRDDGMAFIYNVNNNLESKY